MPTNLRQLLAARAAHPQAQIVAGCTDVGLWVTKMHMQFEHVLDVTQVEELRRIERYENHIAIGAAATLSDAFAALVQERPELKTFAQRFAGLPVRNSGTLGGNVANGSPIGDSMPLLIALNAHIILMSVHGHREMPLEHFYTGYRRNVLAPDEVVAWITVPRPHPSPLPQAGEGAKPGIARSGGERRGLAPSPSRGEGHSLAPSPSRGEGHSLAPSPSRGEGWGEGREFLRAYKISKRYDDDISAVCLVISLTLESGHVGKISIGAGGVAATPARAVRTEAFLAGRPWTEATAREAVQVLRAEFQPISDMRASAAYRSEVLGNLVQRFWLESQGLENINLESFSLSGEAA